MTLLSGVGDSARWRGWWFHAQLVGTAEELQLEGGGSIDFGGGTVHFSSRKLKC